MNTVHNLDTVVYDSTISTPTLILDFDVINQTYDRFMANFPGGEVYYAMKANANPMISKLVVERGGNLEIASLPELERAVEAGASGERIICSNPIKNPVFLRRLKEVGIYATVVDSVFEVEKVAQHWPGSQVYVRLAVDNTGSVLPLAGKFGVDSKTALELCDLARDLGLTPIGLSFHVGSQCLSPMNWVNAIRACGQLWRDAEARGHKFHFLNLGGGFPAGSYHDPEIPTLEDIAELVMPALKEHIPYTPDFKLVLEPGRGLVGEGGRLTATVEGKALRGEEEWLYLDVGVFNGLMETFEGFPPVIRVVAEDVHKRPTRIYTVAGPSCDSCDVVATMVEMPEVHIGDRLVFLDAGAYVSEYAAPFNGFPVPGLVMLNTAKENDLYTPKPVYENAPS